MSFDNLQKNRLGPALKTIAVEDLLNFFIIRIPEYFSLKNEVEKLIALVTGESYITAQVINVFKKNKLRNIQTTSICLKGLSNRYNLLILGKAGNLFSQLVALLLIIKFKSIIYIRGNISLRELVLGLV